MGFKVTHRLLLRTQWWHIRARRHGAPGERMKLAPAVLSSKPCGTGLHQNLRNFLILIIIIIISSSSRSSIIAFTLKKRYKCPWFCMSLCSSAGYKRSKRCWFCCDSSIQWDANRWYDCILPCQNGGAKVQIPKCVHLLPYIAITMMTVITIINIIIIKVFFPKLSFWSPHSWTSDIF